jgi:ABC-type multidrug transport system permease subunit
MFLVTSIAMLRERTSGTLERLLTMPLAKLDLLLGYGIAFALMAALQAASSRGLFVPRDQMARALEIASYALPLTYAYDALERVTLTDVVDRYLVRDVVVIAGATLLALGLGAATPRRRTS